ncbi:MULTISPECIES: nicotinamide mononucleotide transporter family protein [Streptomyces]|uniref:nicotinamide mononucleotide transporter family protein n=1 Tax=Streptomyces TaxID=1883 RepID=UPI0022496921|nr:nicotinamide mononucleotide transporter family protein [Streptomyces sp. JHD 1]MCX2970025.1 nicotinamide mononucleotide transporter family protein [Streptomyces sp. JHD 1]
MSALDGLNAVAFEAFGQPVIWSDMVGNLFGLAALALGWRRSVLTWPVQVLAGAILVAAYHSASLTGGVGKQVLVVLVGLWGWWQWHGGRRDAEDGQVAVRFATGRERLALLAATALGTLAVGGLFTAVPTLSWNPWPDAYIFVGTLAAMYAQARGLVEFWFAWLLVDLVGVPLAFASGLAFSGLVYLVYLVLVLWGLRAWWLRSRAAASAGRPTQLEGTAV